MPCKCQRLLTALYLRGDVGKVPLAPINRNSKTLLGHPASVCAPNGVGDMRQELLLLNAATPDAKAVERVHVEEPVGTRDVRLLSLGEFRNALEQSGWDRPRCEQERLWLIRCGTKVLTNEADMGPSRMR